MNQEALSDLVLRSQSGDADAMEQLLLWAHTPVFYLCRKILQNQQAAREQTKTILQIVNKKLTSLTDPALFESWLCRITAARCIQILPQLRWDSTVAADAVANYDFAGKSLNETETVQAVASLVDTLPEDPRVCILLYCCAGMNSRTVAQVGGYTVDTVRTNLSLGQTLLQEALEKLQEQGTEFSGITSLQEILHSAMLHIDDPDAAMPVVYDILGKEMPLPPDPTRWIVRLLTVVFLLLLIVFLGLCGVLVMKFAGIL